MVCVLCSSIARACHLEPRPSHLWHDRMDSHPFLTHLRKHTSESSAQVMNRRMGTSLTYNHELGIDYNRILPDIIVGSCLQVVPRLGAVLRTCTAGPAHHRRTPAPRAAC